MFFAAKALGKLLEFHEFQRCGGGQHEYLSLLYALRGGFHRGLHADNRYLELGSELFYSGARCGVAGHNDSFCISFRQKFHAVFRKRQNLFFCFFTVRGVLKIRKEDIFFFGEDVLYGAQHRDAAHPGIIYPDRFVVHMFSFYKEAFKRSFIFIYDYKIDNVYLQGVKKLNMFGPGIMKSRAVP